MEFTTNRKQALPEEPDDTSRTVECLDDLDPLTELSEYLDVLSNSTRLQILRCLQKRPCTTREISRDVKTSYENTKKHLERLCLIGVVRKEAGITDPLMKGVQLYWKYSLVPGGLESVIRNLGLFSHMKMHIVHGGITEKIDATRKMLSCELLTKDPVLIVLGGPDDGMTFPLKQDTIRVGRTDPRNKGLIDPGENLVLSQGYSAVSRVSLPHAQVVRDGNVWCIEDCGSRGGTAINKTVLGRKQRVLLKDGDLIELSKGNTGAKLLLIIPGST